MARSSTTWQPGQSGNPSGRPKRALSEILERAGSASVVVGGKRISGKRLVARLVWEIATTGKCVLPEVGEDGKQRVLVAGPQAWLDVVKFIFAQVDGPPPKDVNIGGQGDNPLVIDVVWDESGLDDTPAEAALGAGGGEGA